MSDALDPTTVPTLICPDCGRRLLARGARPGRVGRCPSCGARLTFPEPLRTSTTQATPFQGSETVRARPKPHPPSLRPDREPPGRADHRPALGFVVNPDHPSASSKQSGHPGAPSWFIAAPAETRTGLRDALAYPCWDAQAPALIGMTSPLLTLFSILSIGLMKRYGFEGGFVERFAFWMLFFPPMFALFLNVLGIVLTFLADVLAESAQGRVQHPHWPEWSIAIGLGPPLGWTIAWGLGATLGVVPALAAVNALNWNELWMGSALLIAGWILTSAYALASILGWRVAESWAALNPWVAARTLSALGIDAVRAAAPAGVCGFLVSRIVPRLYEVNGPNQVLVQVFLVWLAGLVAAVVAARHFGTICHHHQRALPWTRQPRRPVGDPGVLPLHREPPSELHPPARDESNLPRGLDPD